ncbi:MAG: PD-(D/E)XK nuclease family protein [Bryobacteraceae bacterium]
MALSKAEYAKAGLDIFNRLDREAIRREIVNGVQGKFGFDFDQAAEMIWTVAQKWLARDTEILELDAIETAFDWRGEKGVLDMCGKFTEEAHSNLAGKRFVRDWKTTGRELNKDWENKYILSHQWKFYLYHSGADVFIYSGVTWQDGGGVREVILYRPDDLAEQVSRLIAGCEVMGRGLVDARLTVYPQNMPDGCTKYGGCAYGLDCRNNTMPRQALEPWGWSPSTIETFLTCPEKMRRNRLNRIAGIANTSGESAELGAAFHRGVAEMYRQVWGMK